MTTSARVSRSRARRRRGVGVALARVVPDADAKASGAGRAPSASGFDRRALERVRHGATRPRPRRREGPRRNARGAKQELEDDGDAGLARRKDRSRPHLILRRYAFLEDQRAGPRRPTWTRPRVSRAPPGGHPDGGLLVKRGAPTCSASRVFRLADHVRADACRYLWRVARRSVAESRRGWRKKSRRARRRTVAVLLVRAPRRLLCSRAVFLHDGLCYNTSETLRSLFTPRRVPDVAAVSSASVSPALAATGEAAARLSWSPRVARATSSTSPPARGARRTPTHHPHPRRSSLGYRP